MSEGLTCEVLVVGAGINGAATAFHLTEHGTDVILLDRGHPASGPTGSSSALTHAFYLDPALSRLGHRGCELLRHMPESIGYPSDYRACGMMWACGAEAAPEWGEAVERIRGEGARIESLTPEQLSEVAPDFAMTGIALGVWEPDGGYADPATATNSLVAAACDRGARLLVGSEVIRLVVSDDRITGVRLADGRAIHAGHVVLAAGPWTKGLLDAIGVQLPLFIERHPMAVLRAPGMATAVMPFSWCDDVFTHYARPDGDSVVLVGTWSGGGTGIRHGTDELPRVLSTPAELVRSVSLDESERIVQHVVPRVPKLSELGVSEGYADLYDMSPDDLPLIGPLPQLQGLYVIAGSSGHGFKTGPAVGEEVARELRGDASPLLMPFRPDRDFEASR
ncbi:MAG TPA: FAD-binding oxidoreductase [Microbacteriaceae bacterium]|nr:FAD-binding oxidoreductase [Microbacteriaceae bacterium]